MVDKTKTSKKHAEKYERKQDLEGRKTEKSAKKPSKSTKQAETTPPETGAGPTAGGTESTRKPKSYPTDGPKLTSAAQEQPIAPTPPATPRRPGARGPDKKPRRTRKDKGKPKLSEEELRAQVRQEVESELESQVQARVKEEFETRWKSARMLTNGFVVTGGVVMNIFLPPQLSAAEKADLTEAWLPIVERNMDRLSDLLPPILCTTAVVAPRLGAAVARHRAKRWKQPPHPMPPSS